MKKTGSRNVGIHNIPQDHAGYPYSTMFARERTTFAIQHSHIRCTIGCLNVREEFFYFASPRKKDSFEPLSMWVFPKIGVPQNVWFIMENPIKMDDLGGPPLFLETSMSYKLRWNLLMVFLFQVSMVHMLKLQHCPCHFA